jgi:hypothetical protein
MAKRGIDNVLGSLLGNPQTEPDAKPEPTAQAAEAAADIPPLPIAEPEKPRIPATPAARTRGARRGRPPGSRAGEGSSKVKKTYAIDAGLYDACVSRSWKEEMQMGELIEKALRLYLKTPLKQPRE